jgi:ATP-dependent DNA helicase RecQ
MDVLRGKATERVQQWDHDKLAVFGIGADVDEPTWRNVFRQLVALGYARPDHDAYGGLRLTDAARPVLKGEESVEMRRPSVSVKKRKSRGKVASTDPLFERLKNWRLEQAREQSVPPYVVFHDATLAAIAAARPRSVAELSKISGIGAKKLDRYGEALLRLLRLARIGCTEIFAEQLKATGR